jgi:hypothetical protein
MREGALAWLVVMGAGAVARAHPHDPHPQHVDAQLVCMSGTAKLTDGDHHPIDHDVTCAIGADLDVTMNGDLVGAIYVAVAEPLGGTANASAMISTDGGGWHGDAFGLGSDLLRCADTTIHATLRHDDHLVWEQTLHVRPSCPKVRFVRAPKLVCDGVTSIWLTTEPNPDDPDQVKQAAEDRRNYPRIECKITVEKPPHDVALVAYVRRTPPADGAAPSDPADRIEPTTRSDGALIAIEPEPLHEPSCDEVKVDAVLVRDGGVVWTGHDHYFPKCPDDKPH